MTRSRLLLGVAAVLVGAAVLFVVLGAVFNPLLAVVAAPFAIGGYFLWAQATGRLEARVRRRVVDRQAYQRRQRGAPAGRTGSIGGDGPTSWETAAGARRSMDRREALAALDLSTGANQRAIRQAYRDRVKAVHPDTEGGDEDEFRRVRAAYETLRRNRGKG